MSWKSRLIHLARLADAQADDLRHAVRRRFGSDRPVRIVPYRSYGTATNLYLRGRVLHNAALRAATDGDSGLRNLVNMYRRFESDEVRGATVEVTLPDDTTLQTLSDREGYFRFDVELDGSARLDAHDLYQRFALCLVDSPYGHWEAGEIVEAQAMIPPVDAELGIISDIDDTVIQTGAHNLLAMGRTVLFANARTRLPFPGVAEFYEALRRGRSGRMTNPFFYVSSSPWNLYDLLTDFLDLNKIPEGPLLLRDFGIGSESFTSGNYLGHKFSEISAVLDKYPSLPFILLGDSGEQDPPIYLEVVRRYPGRIQAVYIRDVVAGEKHRIAQEVAAEMKKLGVEMLLAADSVEAAKHAASRGFIYREELPAVAEEAAKDAGEAPGKIEIGTTGDAESGPT